MNNISFAGVILGIIAGVAIPLISNTLFFWLAVGLAPVIALVGSMAKQDKTDDFKSKVHSA